MELIYLWVDDNNRQLDLNFHSRYNCIYTPNQNNNKLGLLEIKSKKQDKYLDNLYGENIRISAIVGKNASGKSSLLRLIWNGSYNDEMPFFALIRDGDKLKIVGAKDKNKRVVFDDLLDNGVLNIKLKLIREINTALPLKKVATLLFTNEDDCYKNIANSVQIASTQRYASMECLKKKKLNESSRKLFVKINETIKYLSGDLIAKHYSGSDYSDYIDNLNKEFQSKLISYEKLKLDVESDLFEKSLVFLFDNEISWYEDMQKPTKVYFGINKQVWNNFTFAYEDIYFSEYATTISSKMFSYYTLMWFDQLHTSHAPSDAKNDYTEVFNKYFKNITGFTIEDIETFINEMLKIRYGGKATKSESLSSYRFGGKYFKYLFELYNRIKLLEDMFTDIEEGVEVELLDEYQVLVSGISKLNVLLVREGLNINSILIYKFLPILSSGNQSILNTFTNLYDNLNVIEEKKVFLLLDEVEVFLHPDWQKRYVSLLLSFLRSKFKDINFHIIIATHSPFILSDIPVGNIAFLDATMKSEQTFGANIHTLLSDSFFMTDGLMGEYAKGKVNDVYDFIKNNGKKMKSKKEAQSIINLVGEPIIKKQLQILFDEKYSSKNDINDKILRLEQEIKELKKKKKRND